jgi:hypothetical protein
MSQSYIRGMMKLNYTDLTIKEILELADGDLDQAQLATRLARRLGLDVKQLVHGGVLSAGEQNDLGNVTYVTDEVLRGGAH